MEKQSRVGETTHGESRSKLYKVWTDMKCRCDCITHHAYKLYGARGISVCQEWYDYDLFKKWALTNGYCNGLSIDRIDNDGNYCPSNCRWTTRKTQQNNNRGNHFVQFNGESLTIAELANKVGIRENTLRVRLCRGWTLEEAVMRPIGGGCNGQQKAI